MVVGLMGILKAGADYVPLDPNYPAERLQYMLEDAAPAVVMTQEELQGVLPASSAQVIALDRVLKDLHGWEGEDLPAVELGLTPEQAVYVIYTSGSTGRPKGTQMLFRAMVNLIHWHRSSLSAGEGRRVLQFAALSFDVAFQEIFSTVCTGGTLVLLSEWVRRDARALSELLSGSRIQRLFVPPLMLLCLVVCAVLSASSALPLGVAGEIYVGGVALAHGYRGRPELTEERFVKDPFRAGGRLYRTGDRGRWSAEGTLEYLGRNDDQVKLRGYRIELGEIEAQLLRHPGVREAAVVVREEDSGERRLVAYITAQGESGPEVEGLREHLKGILPEYMVPGAFVVLEKLPLTPNGKLDRRGLPAPQQEAYASSRYEPPEGELESALAQIWGELLHVQRFGRHDNFFELGGHSLLGMRLTSRVSEVLGVTLPVIAVFHSPTIEKMACIIAAAQEKEAEFEEGML